MNLEKKIEEAKSLVTSLLNNKMVYKYSQNKFTYTSDDINTVLKNVANAEIPEVKTYKPVNRFGRMVAFTTPEHDCIYLNTYKRHTVHSLVISISHELFHCCSYGHGSNTIHFWNKRKKMASVNYALSNALGKMYMDGIR